MDLLFFVACLLVTKVDMLSTVAAMAVTYVHIKESGESYLKTYTKT